MSVHEENWASRRMTMFQSTIQGQPVIQDMEVTRHQFEVVAKLFSERPIFEVMHMLEVELKEKKAGIDARFDELTQAQQKGMADQLETIQKIRDDLVGVDHDLKTAVENADYRLATLIEAKKLEIRQALLTAELKLADVKEQTQIELTRYAEEIYNGKMGSGAEIDGLDYTLIGNITRAIIWEWLSVNVSQGLPQYMAERAYYAGRQLEVYRAEKLEATQKLGDFKKAAAARFSSGGVREVMPDPVTQAPSQGVVTPNQANPAAPIPVVSGQQQRQKGKEKVVVSVGGPKLDRFGMPSWGEVG